MLGWLRGVRLVGMVMVVVLLRKSALGAPKVHAGGGLGTWVVGALGKLLKRCSK